jgi:hypothetical protein
MRRLLILGLVLLAGCQSVRGPLAPRDPQRADDPRYSVQEQERRTRDQLPLPDESRTIAPTFPATTQPTPVWR